MYVLESYNFFRRVKRPAGFNSVIPEKQGKQKYNRLLKSTAGVSFVFKQINDGRDL